MHREAATVLRALLARSANAEDSKALRHRVIQAAYKPGPMCRDCADRDGTCYDGTKCDPFEAALDTLRACAKSTTRDTKAKGAA